MNKAAVGEIHTALEAVRTTLPTFNGCDADDIDELIERAEQEISAPLPRVQVLDTYLNSIARSLRAEPQARRVCMQLDEAMRHAGVPTNWEPGL